MSTLMTLLAYEQTVNGRAPPEVLTSSATKGPGSSVSHPGHAGLEVLGMKAAVIYESMFGNTRMIAEAVADGLGRSRAALDVVVRAVTEATPGDVVGLDFLVVGGPTHLRRMTSRRTREMRVGSRSRLALRGVATTLKHWPSGGDGHA